MAQRCQNVSTDSQKNTNISHLEIACKSVKCLSWKRKFRILAHWKMNFSSFDPLEINLLKYTLHLLSLYRFWLNIFLNWWRSSWSPHRKFDSLFRRGGWCAFGEICSMFHFIMTTFLVALTMASASELHRLHASSKWVKDCSDLIQAHRCLVMSGAASSDQTQSIQTRAHRRAHTLLP